ncbi:MAG: DUF1653 domain-containing protein [Erysipelotrichaceae bacterium]|nr:DUF1653 domain-containing protein [Erysipelotrichaceae bacterium]
MLERNVKVGKKYKHFKGTHHKVICLAKDSETLEEKVVYTHEEDGTIWLRDKKEFLSEVDHQKYPNINQKYRFEEIKD